MSEKKPLKVIKRSDGPRSDDVNYQERRAIIALLKIWKQERPEVWREIVQTVEERTA